jgi:hypothetical protein
MTANTAFIGVTGILFILNENAQRDSEVLLGWLTEPNSKMLPILQSAASVGGAFDCTKVAASARDLSYISVY